MRPDSIPAGILCGGSDRQEVPARLRSRCRKRDVTPATKFVDDLVRFDPGRDNRPTHVEGRPELRAQDIGGEPLHVHAVAGTLDRRVERGDRYPLLTWIGLPPNAARTRSSP